MAINGTRTASDPTAFGLISRGIKEDLVLTLGMKAGASVIAGDLVKLTAGYIEKCTAETDVVMGIAKQTMDNTYGSAGTAIAVVVRGIMEQDALTADATYTVIRPGMKVYLAPAVSLYCAAGQAVSIYASGGNILVGKSLDFVTAPTSGSAINKIRVIFDFASNAVAWV